MNRYVMTLAVLVLTAVQSFAATEAGLAQAQLAGAAKTAGIQWADGGRELASVAPVAGRESADLGLARSETFNAPALTSAPPAPALATVKKDPARGLVHGLIILAAFTILLPVTIVCLLAGAGPWWW